jgi:superfamily II DNA helicase RecQ
LDNAISTEMNRVWCLEQRPFAFQLHCVRLLLWPHRQQRPKVLSVQATGKGKSLCMQTAGTLLGGVTLVIVPLLALGADQVTKILRACNAFGKISAYHLDEIKTSAARNQVVQELLDLEENTQTSIFLFSSPQAIVGERTPWKGTLLDLHRRRLLRLVVIDELHLYLQFGVSLRSEFKQLTNMLLNVLFPSSDLQSHPCLLVMTATITKRWLELFQKLTGISFIPSDILWALPDDMARRDVKVSFYLGDTVLKKMRLDLISFLKSSTTKKVILYTNTRVTANKLKVSIDELMDANDIEGDAIVIHGDLLSHTKFYRAKQFTGALDDGILKPRVLIATSGCANAGIDCPDVYWVLRQDMPPSILDLFQEMGRAGRRYIKVFGEDHYIVIFSLNSFDYLYIRPMSEKDDIIPPLVMTRKEKIELAQDSLMQVLDLLVLDKGCKHKQMENILGKHLPNYFSRLGDCRCACPTCLPRSTYEHVFPPIKKSGICSLLLQEFSQVGRMLLTPPQQSSRNTGKSFIEWMKKRQNIGKSIYGWDSDRKPTENEIECTVLQLIATKMLLLTTSTLDDCDTECVYVSLSFQNNVAACMIHSLWEGIHVIPEE